MVALLLAAALSATACADLSTSQAGAPGAASLAPSTSANTGTGDCVALGAVTPAPAPPLAVTGLGDGTQRVTSAEGGYSIVVPRAWSATGTSAGAIPAFFAQAHMSSFDDRTTPTPRPEAGSIRPPEVGIHFDIELWADPFGELPDAYARRILLGPDQSAILPGAFVTVGGQRAYRFTIQDERRFQPANAPLITTRQTRAVWIVPTPRADRMLVLYATPAESALLAEVERAVATLHVTTQVRSVLPIAKQRGEILQQWLVGKSGPIPGRRVEAKLLTYAETAVAMYPGQPRATPNGILRIDRDPEDLFWVVAVSGPDLPQPLGGPLRLNTPASTPSPTAWMLYLTPATSGGSSIGGMSLSTSGTWPPGFDALPDRCH